MLLHVDDLGKGLEHTQPELHGIHLELPFIDLDCVPGRASDLMRQALRVVHQIADLAHNRDRVDVRLYGGVELVVPFQDKFLDRKFARNVLEGSAGGQEMLNPAPVRVLADDAALIALLLEISGHECPEKMERPVFWAFWRQVREVYAPLWTLEISWLLLEPETEGIFNAFAQELPGLRSDSCPSRPSLRTGACLFAR